MSSAKYGMGPNGPTYKQKLKREDRSQKEIQCWSEAAEEHARECLDSVDWTIFKNSIDNLGKYATIVTGFISKCIEACVPKMTIHVLPNRKPWMNQEIYFLLKAGRAVFSKTKELIIGFRKKGGEHAPSYINGVPRSDNNQQPVLDFSAPDDSLPRKFLCFHDHHVDVGRSGQIVGDHYSQELDILDHFLLSTIE
eukprot:g45003.t1